ncbi:MAG: efflux RND transporter periplasmic adaptor subunit [Desulfomonilia bacterium]
MAIRRKPRREGASLKFSSRAWGILRLAAIAACMAALFSGCLAQEQEAGDGKIHNVRIHYVEHKTVRPSIGIMGTLEPFSEVIVSSEVNGVLKELLVDAGTPVTKGMVLARINDTDYRLDVMNAEAALKQAKAALANLRTEHGRMQSLVKKGSVSVQQFEEISTRLTVAAQDVDRADAALSLARERLSKTVIRSPMTGVVKMRRVTPGELVTAGMPLLAIVQIDPLKLSLAVTEKDVGFLEKGQEVNFTVDAFPGSVFTGTLSVIYPSLDERTRSLKAEAIVENPSERLKPGLFAKASLYTTEPRDVVVIPITSILYDGSQVRVFIEEGGKARERYLKIGEKYGEEVEVIEGLSGGESLIVVGQNTLFDGAMVNVVD